MKIGFSKFCTLHRKWCVIADSPRTHLVCVCTNHQNNILLVEALNFEVTYKDLVNEVVCDKSNCECVIHCCTNCPRTNILGKFVEEELSDIDPDIQLHYSQWQTTDSMDAEWIFFAISHGKSPCDGVGVFVKCYVAKHNLQRPPHDQILSYQSILDLCVRQILPLHFLV